MATRTRFDKVNKIDGNNHLILLCKNETGYKNLIKMVSAAFVEGFYSSPALIRNCWKNITRSDLPVGLFGRRSSTGHSGGRL